MSRPVAAIGAICIVATVGAIVLIVASRPRLAAAPRREGVEVLRQYDERLHRLEAQEASRMQAAHPSSPAVPEVGSSTASEPPHRALVVDRETVRKADRMVNEEIDRRVTHEARDPEYERAVTSAVETHFNDARLENVTCVSTACSVAARMQGDQAVHAYLKDVFDYLPPYDEVAYSVDTSNPENPRVDLRVIRRGAAEALHAEINASLGLPVRDSATGG